MTYKHPAMTWLIKHDPEAALAVFHRLRDEYYTHGEAAGDSYLSPRERNPDDIETHDIPDELHTGDSMSEAAPDGPDDINMEMLHELQPDLHVMLRSAGGIAWPWCGVRVKRDGKVTWAGEPWAYEFPERPSLTGKHLVALKGLTYYTRPGARAGFDGGMLLSYVDDAGRIKRPVLKANKPRGGKRAHRDNLAGYLALPGAVISPLTATGWQRPLSGDPALISMFDPQAGTQEARAILREHGIDGSVPLDRLPFAAKKLPDAIAKNARFIGGVSGRCQTTKPPTVGKWEPPEPLAGKAAEIIDEVAARGTLESIGIRLGYTGGYADRAGKKALLVAGRALVASNDNSIAKKVAA